MIAQKLKAWRLRAGFSQSEAARELRISVRTLQGWEGGRRQPRGLAMVRLLEITKEDK